MSEVNERWQRDHYNLQKQTVIGTLAAGTLWLLSFYASMPAAFGASAHELWFGFASITTFLAATGLTAASGIGVFALLTDDPPLEGGNR